MRSHKARLEYLKHAGYVPQGIIDIGAHVGKWSEMIHSVFPNAPILMIEGNQDHKEKLLGALENIQHRMPDSELEITLLSDQAKEAIYYKTINGGTSGNSLYKENTPSYAKENVIEEIRKTTTLDEIVKRSGPTYDFIKLDVQGAEADVLKGALATMEHAKFILMETQLLEYNQGAPLFHSIIELMASYGFQMADVYEFHYLPDGRLNEVDVLFAKSHDPMFCIDRNKKINKKEKTADIFNLCLNMDSPISIIKKLMSNQFRHGKSG
ncbi:MAG: FkbM family methyltransferase [Gammaproteobacteria bacterium]